MTRICVCPFGLRGPRRIPHALPNCFSAEQLLLWSAARNEAVQNGLTRKQLQTHGQPAKQLDTSTRRPKDACSCTAWRSRDPGSRPGKSPKQARRLVHFCAPLVVRELDIQLHGYAATRRAMVRLRGRAVQFAGTCAIAVHRAAPCSRRLPAATRRPSDQPSQPCSSSCYSSSVLTLRSWIQQLQSGQDLCADPHRRKGDAVRRRLLAHLDPERASTRNRPRDRRGSPGTQGSEYIGVVSSPPQSPARTELIHHSRAGHLGCYDAGHHSFARLTPRWRLPLDLLPLPRHPHLLPPVPRPAPAHPARARRAHHHLVRRPDRNPVRDRSGRRHRQSLGRGSRALHARL